MAICQFIRQKSWLVFLLPVNTRHFLEFVQGGCSLTTPNFDDVQTMCTGVVSP